NATPIFAQKMSGRVAITNETVNGYNAIAAADPKGAIMTDPRGKQIVYTLGAQGPKAAANAAPSTGPAPASPAARPTASAASAQAAASRPGGDFLPLCLLE